MKYYVYILTNKNQTTLYIGVTGKLKDRIHQHKNKLVPGFTAKYNLTKLIYYEETSDVKAAIAREKQIKKWRREKKENLIKTTNPEWCDLAQDW